MTLAEA